MFAWTFRNRKEIATLLQPHVRLLGIGAALMSASRLCGLVAPYCIKYLIDAVNGAAVPQLYAATAAITIALAADVAASRAGAHCLARATNRFIADLRAALLRRILNMPVRALEDRRLGALVSNVMDDGEGVRLLIGEATTSRMLRMFEAIAGTIFLAWLSPALTLTTLACIAAGVTVAARGCRAALPLSRRHRELNSEFSAMATDLVNGARVIKAHAGEERQSDSCQAEARKLADVAVSLREHVTSSYARGSFLLGLCLPLTAFQGIRAVLHHQLTIGALAAFTALLWRVLWSFMDLIAIGADLSTGFTALERVTELLRQPLELPATLRLHSLSTIRGSFTARNLWFGYAERPVLRGLAFEIAPGSVTAIVGRSGSGKTTLMGLLAGFYRPDHGSLEVDGEHLTQVDLREYRRRVAYVQQQAYIFGGTLRSNLLLSNPSASPAAIAEACRLTGISQFCDELENGLDTVLGEQGVKLSGGQRQRVAIARAILADPDVLLLDEVTANLDYDSDATIQHTLAQLMQGRTTVLVAHRLSSVARASQILVLDAGRIVEAGDHESLIRGGGYYSRLYQTERYAEAEFS